MKILISVLLSLIPMAGLFLMLWAEVGFIQSKKMASSAPKEELDVMPDSKPERFRGQHVLGWILAVFSLVLILGAFVLGAYDGIRNGFTYVWFFVRFLIMLLLLKAFDVIFFDWVLLCHNGFNFYGHYYPEVKPVLSPRLFGYNWKSHVIQTAIFIVLAAVMAWICTLF